MKHFIVLFLVLTVACTVYGNDLSHAQSYELLVRHPRQLDLLGGTRRVIEQLVDNLRTAAKETTDAMTNFTSAIQTEAQRIEEKVVNDIQRLRDRMAQAIENLTNRLIDSGVAVVDCIASHREDATAIFDTALSKAMSCVDQRLSEASEQIKGLAALANDGIAFANIALADMKKCTQDNEGHLLNTGTCLGKLAMQTEAKALVFGTQMTVALGHINLSLGTLPASLEVCAGTRLVESSISTAKIIIQIGTCSAASVFSILVGPSQYPLTTLGPILEPIVATETPALK